MSTIELFAECPERVATAFDQRNPDAQPMMQRDFERSSSTAGKMPTSPPIGPLGVCIASFYGVILRTLLLPGLRTVNNYLHRLHHERTAMVYNSGRDWSRLEKIYDRTLDRLGDTRSTSSWWQRLVLFAETDCVLPHRRSKPHFLAIPSVKEWLSNGFVRADLKQLASETIFGLATNTTVARQRLADRYAHYTGEDPALAAGSIKAVVSGLVAGVFANLSASEQLLIELMRYSNLARTQPRMFCYDHNRSAANSN